MFFPFLSRGPTVTLSIENTMARMLVASGNRVEKAASAPLDPGLVVEGVVQDAEKVGEILSELFQSENVPKGQVVTCVAGSHTIYKTFSLPPMRQADVAGAVMYQAKRDMPVPVDELVMSWQAVGQPQEGQNNVFVVGVPRDVISTYMAAFRHARIRPKAIDIKPLALARAVNRDTVIIGNVEVETVEVIYVSDNTPAIVRTIHYPFPASSATELGQRLADELQLTIRFYNDANRMRPVRSSTPIVLSGGGADYFSLTEALYGYLDYTVERINPPIECPIEISMEEYAVNIGLALKGRKV
ncbi:MAG: type pilus assembly family protein [Dehalococcoidia bacterium]|nr:type pilus assembly family protein [Dehalococcoidia bacterium]